MKHHQPRIAATILALSTAALIATSCSTGTDTTTAPPERPVVTVTSTQIEQDTEPATTATDTEEVSADSSGGLRAAAAKAYGSSEGMRAAVTDSCASKLSEYGDAAYESMGATIVSINEEEGTVTTQIEGQEPSTDPWALVDSEWKLDC